MQKEGRDLQDDFIIKMNEVCYNRAKRIQKGIETHTGNELSFRKL
jgi:hypothetical protein